MKNIYIIFLLFFLNSCLGAGVFYPSKTDCMFDENGKTDDMWCQSFTKKKEILYRYGNPEKIEKLSDQEEKWVYKTKGFRWLGIMPIIIIPLPIGIPVNSNYKYLYFKNDLLIRREEKYTKFKIAWCGLSFMEFDQKIGSVKEWGCAAK